MEKLLEQIMLVIHWDISSAKGNFRTSSHAS